MLSNVDDRPIMPTSELSTGSGRAESCSDIHY